MWFVLFMVFIISFNQYVNHYYSHPEDIHPLSIFVYHYGRLWPGR